jgi:TrfA protein
LQGYYATHAKPLPVKVETLRNLSGSKTAALFKFRQQLRQALDELKAISAIAAWQIDDADLVTVDRGNAITASQRRHLTRRKRKD